MSRVTSPAARFTGTYRLQLHSGFTLHDARATVPYLAELGVSHVYLAPILSAVQRSLHGYDVLDHTSINPDLGGRPALERLAADCHHHGLGIVVDIVPNHMALTAPQWRNAPLWDVLRHGRGSSFARGSTSTGTTLRAVSDCPSWVPRCKTSRTHCGSTPAARTRAQPPASQCCATTTMCCRCVRTAPAPTT